MPQADSTLWCAHVVGPDTLIPQLDRYWCC